MFLSSQPVQWLVLLSLEDGSQLSDVVPGQLDGLKLGDFSVVESWQDLPQSVEGKVDLVGSLPLSSIRCQSPLL